MASHGLGVVEQRVWSPLCGVLIDSQIFVFCSYTEAVTPITLSGVGWSYKLVVDYRSLEAYIFFIVFF